MSKAKEQEQSEAQERLLTSSQERMLAIMRSRGHLVAGTAGPIPEAVILEAQLPPYGSKQEAELLRELSRVASEAFRAAGTTATDEVIQGREE